MTLWCLLTIAAGAAPVEIVREWDGKIADAAVRKHAPDSGAVVDERAWKTLWSAWRGDQPLPEVDFAKHLLLVTTVDGPNAIVVRPRWGDKPGDLLVIAASTKVAGPGFGYRLSQIPRQGIRTINGKPLQAGAVSGQLVIPAGVASFSGRRLEVRLWEFDPRLADASAKMFGSLTVDDYAHAQGKETRTPLSLGDAAGVRQDRGYYVTAFVLQDSKRTHMGEKDGKRGLCKVLTMGNPAQVRMVVRDLGR